MPGTVRGARDAGMFPKSLFKKFTSSRSVQARINEYHDGTTQRQSLVSEVRRSWKLTKRLVPSKMVELREFWEAHRNDAFWFYDPIEMDVPFLLEIIPPTWTSTAVLTLTTAYTTDPLLLPGATASIYGVSFAFGQFPAFSRNASYAKTTDTFNVTNTLLRIQLTDIAGIDALSLYFYIDNNARGSGNAHFDIYDSFLTLTRTPATGITVQGLYLVRFASDWDQTIGLGRSDALVELVEVKPEIPPLAVTTTQIFRPTSTSFIPGSGHGSMIENPPTSSSAYAIDGDPNTYAQLNQTNWSPLEIPSTLVLSNFA
ncbi:MAG: hypothetical protein ACR2JB_19125 [Bryobacteraceae bacterium]